MLNKGMTVDCQDNLHKQERKAVIYERTDTTERPPHRLPETAATAASTTRRL